MALTTTEKAALIALGIDEVMLKGRGIAARTIKSIAKAAVRVSPYVARAAVPAARSAAGVAGSLAAANPISTGLGLGLGFTQTPQGQAVLEAAAERGAADRIALEQAIDERVFRAQRAAEEGLRIASTPTVQASIKRAAKRKVSKYQKAVKAGMKAVKASKFNGKKGTISNAKKTFATVNKVASAVNKGKKVATKGVAGTIARAVRKIL
jgi:hypothetical protein